MQKRTVTIPELMLIAGTRFAFGVGVGLLIGEKVPRDARRGAGWALVAVGAVTTIPLALGVLGKPQIDEAPDRGAR